MNCVNITGRIGQLDLKKFNDGAVTNLSVAVDDSYFSKDKNEWQEKTEWVKCAIPKETKLLKGDLVEITGKIRTRSYDSNGEKKYITEVFVKNYKLLHRKK